MTIHITKKYREELEEQAKGKGPEAEEAKRHLAEVRASQTPSKTAPRSPADQQTGDSLGDSGWDGMTQAQKERWLRGWPRDWSNKNVR